MTIRVALHHETTYQYDRRISLGPQVIRLRPAPHCRTPITSYSLRVEPANHFLNWVQDPFSNYAARAVFNEKVDRRKVSVDVVADMTVINPFEFFLEPNAEEFPFAYAPTVSGDLKPFLEIEESGPLLLEFLTQVELSPRRTIDFLVDLNRLVQQA